MKEVSAILGSMGKNKKSAQVRVLIGEGSKRRSITRHPKLDKGIWVGRNPNEQTESLHAAADRRVFAAQTVITETTGILKNLRENTGRLQELVKGADVFKAIVIEAAMKEAARMIAEEEENLRLFEENQKNAEKYREDVERDYPLYVQFNF